MNLVISKCVTAVKVSNFSGHYLRNRSTLGIGVLGYIGIYIYICREIGLEVSADKTKDMVMSRDQNAGRNHSVRIERVEEFKYLGSTLTYENYIPEEIKSRLRSGNAC